MGGAIAQLKKTFPQAGQPQPTAGDGPAVPAGAIPEMFFTWSRWTAGRVFDRLSRTGHAWRLPNGSRVFDATHPIIRRQLAREAGRSDAEWEAAPFDKREQALRWCRFLELAELRADRAERHGRSRKEVVARACKNLASEHLECTIAVATYYKRLKEYITSGRKRSSMLDRRRGAAFDGITISADAWATFEKLYLTRQRRTVKDCWEIVAGLALKKGWRWPSYSAIRKRVARQWPACKADLYRLGERKWRAKHAPKIVRDKVDLPANHTHEIDHFRHDFWTRHGGKRVRPWCSIIVDRGSNLPVGWSITTNPSSDSLSLAMRRAVKAYGAPLKTVLDNGRDMAARSFGNKRGWVDEKWAGGVFDQLGVELSWCNAFSPWEKGVVESFARIVHDQFDRQFQSYCGGSPQARPDGADKWAAENIDKLPTLAEVEKLFAEYVAAYAERPSSAKGIAPLSPRQRFEQTRIAKRTISSDVLDVLLLKLDGPRAVTSKGVLHLGIYYSDPRLFSYQGKKVFLRSDPDDLSFIWVCDSGGKPLFVAMQNRVQGTAEDARRARLRTARVKKGIRKATVEQRIAFDDTVSGILRARREHYLAEARLREPKERRAVNVAPIRTPAADALAGEEATIRRENARRKAASLRPAEKEKPLTFADLIDRLEPLEEPARPVSFADLYEAGDFPADRDALDALDAFDNDEPAEAAG